MGPLQKPIDTPEAVRGDIALGSELTPKMGLPMTTRTMKIL
jgi:hypothetical protein